jgi:hypothetical protein
MELPMANPFEIYTPEVNALEQKKIMIFGWFF